MEWLPIIILGVLVGGISSVLGLGGGVLIVPLLPEFANISQKETIATSLLTILTVVSVNAYFYNKKKLVQWAVVSIVGPVSALFAYLSGSLSVMLPDRALKLILATVIFVLGLRIFLSKKKKDDIEVNRANVRRQWKVFSLLGSVAGFVSGLSGIGAGIIMSPTMLHFKVVNHKEVSPTSNGIMIFTTLFGALAFLTQPGLSLQGWQYGYIHLDYVLGISTIALIVAKFGRQYQTLLSAQQRRLILGFILAAFSLKEFIKAL